jgi:protein ImuB
MSASEAWSRVPDLVGRDRDPEAEAAAAGALVDVARSVSPRLETVAPGAIHLDLAGIDALWGTEPRLGERLLLGAASVGLPARIGIAGTRTAAALAARLAAGITCVPPAAERAFLAPVPVALADPPAELAAALERWGIRTLGALAALPPDGLAVRLGTSGVRLQRLARGEDDRPLVPETPAEPCVEALTLDWEITALEALAFVLHRLLDRLAARLAVREAGAAALALTAALADGGLHRHRLTLGAPLRQPRTLARLLLGSLHGLALPAPIVALRVEAEAVPLPPLQADLFGPPRPSPRELGETLGRLAALVGADRVGAPALADTHRPDAARLEAFMPSGPKPDAAGARLARGPARQAAVAALALANPATLVVRRLSPPRPAVVECREGAPVRIEAAGVTGPVVAAAGPWRTHGEWWTDTAWTREEWDVALPDGAVYRLALDQAVGAWSIDAVYD